MPKLDGKEYGYDKAGYSAYIKALKKRRKKKIAGSARGQAMDILPEHKVR